MTGGGKVAEGAPFKAIPIEGGKTSFGVWSHLFWPPWNLNRVVHPFWNNIDRLGKIWVVARRKSKENPSGMRTRSEVEAAAQTRADKIQAPVYIWYTKGGSQTRPGWAYSEKPPSGGVKYFTIQPSKKNPTCSYRKTKRSKVCGGRVALMKNGRIHKCKACGAKYEMR